MDLRTAAAKGSCCKNRLPRISIRPQKADTHTVLSVSEESGLQPPSGFWQAAKPV